MKIIHFLNHHFDNGLVLSLSLLKKTIFVKWQKQFLLAFFSVF